MVKRKKGLFLMSVPNFTTLSHTVLGAAIDSKRRRCVNIAASSNEVAKQSYDPENLLGILRTVFGTHAASLVRIHQRFAELRPNFLFDGLTAHFDWL